MAYNKTIWKSKDIITREKMQKIEDQLEALSEQDSGTSDYLELENKPQINGVTLTGNKSLTDLGVAATSDVAAKYTKPGTGIPASDLSNAVQASLNKADTALQGENLANVVNNYIETNFSNPSSPPLDRTLSTSSSAAPADMVGDLKSALENSYQYATGYDCEFKNGIYSTAMIGINPANNYKYGYSNDRLFNIGENGKIIIKCSGYYIRLFRFPNSGADGADYTEYQADSIEATGTDSLCKIGFTIRKNPDSSTALTDAEMADITAKTKIRYTYNSDNLANIVSAKFGELDANIDLQQKTVIPFTLAPVNAYVNGGNGNVASSNNYYCTDFVDVTNYSTLYYKRPKSTSPTPVTGMAFYDANKAFLSSKRALGGQSGQGYVSGYDALIVPSNAKYARFSVLKDAETYGDFELYGQSYVYNRANAVLTNTGSELAFINGIYSSTIGIINKNYKYGYSISKPLNIGKNGHINILCPGYYIRAFRLPPNGVNGFDYTEYTTDFVELSGTDALTRIGFTIRLDPNDSSDLTQEQMDAIENALIVQYTTDTNSPNHAIATNIVQNSQADSVVGSPSLYLSDPVTGLDIVNSQYTDVYAIYDNLCSSHPQWIQRQPDIGSDSGENAIRHYTVRMFNPIVGYAADYTYGSGVTNYWQSTFGYRKILINTGVHGNEKSSIWATALFVQELITSDEDWARFIRANFEIEIIPLLCPWCYEHDSRENANGVNVNRDYFTPDATKQPETLAITSYINSISDDLFCALDIHTTSGDYNYIATPESNIYLPVIMRLANQIYGACVDEWGTIMNNLGIDSTHYPYAYGCISTNAGTLPDYMIGSGITGYAVTIEGVNFDSDNSGLVAIIKIIKDMLGNMLVGFTSLSK